MEPTAAGKPQRGGLRRLGAWCARHFLFVILAWLVALVALQVTDRAVGGTFEDNFALSDTQSQKGLDVLKEHDPQAGGYSAQIVMHDDQKALSALSSQMSTTVGDLQKLPHVLSVQNPLSQSPTKSGRSRATARPATSPSASTSSPTPSATRTSTASTRPSSRCARPAPTSSTAARSASWPGPKRQRPDQRGDRLRGRDRRPAHRLRQCHRRRTAPDHRTDRRGRRASPSSGCWPPRSPSPPSRRPSPP